MPRHCRRNASYRRAAAGLVVLHRLDGDPRRLLVGEVELSGGDAAERHAAAPVSRGQLQTRPVAGGQQGPVPIRHRPVDDGPHRVQHIPAGQVIGVCDLGPAGRPVVLYVFVRNTRAVAFYRRLGFCVAAQPSPTRYIMRREADTP